MEDSRGIWTSTTDLDLLLRLAAAGFDWVALDAQHGPLDRGQLHPVARGLATARVPFLVRVPAVDPAWIGAALDAGAAAVVVPSVTGVADAEVAARATRYPPAGERSWGQFAPLWGADAVAPDTADAAARCWVMVETPGALGEVDEIAAVPGVDGLFVGPLDLARSLGTTVEALLADRSEDGAIARVVTAARRHDILVGAFAGTPDNARRLGGLGIRCVAVTTDVAVVAEGTRSVLAALDRAGDVGRS